MARATCTDCGSDNVEQFPTGGICANCGYEGDELSCAHLHTTSEEDGTATCNDCGGHLSVAEVDDLDDYHREHRDAFELEDW